MVSLFLLPGSYKKVAEVWSCCLGSCEKSLHELEGKHSISGSSAHSSFGCCLWSIYFTSIDTNSPHLRAQWPHQNWNLDAGKEPVQVLCAYSRNSAYAILLKCHVLCIFCFLKWTLPNRLIICMLFIYEAHSATCRIPRGLGWICVYA